MIDEDKILKHSPSFKYISAPCEYTYSNGASVCRVQIPTPSRGVGGDVTYWNLAQFSVGSDKDKTYISVRVHLYKDMKDENPDYKNSSDISFTCNKKEAEFLRDMLSSYIKRM